MALLMSMSRKTKRLVAVASLAVIHDHIIWNGLIPMYEVTQGGAGSQFREKEQADAEYMSRLRSLREQAMPHPFFSSPKDNQAKAERFSEAVSNLKYEVVLITREEWDDIYGPNGTAVWMA